LKKVGRNDPCPCGSGKKYKRCCLEKDRASNITRIAPDPAGTPDAGDLRPELPSTAETVEQLINERLPWDNPSHKVLAKIAAFHFEGKYGWDQIATAVLAWNLYANAENPVVRKPLVVLAALEYLMARTYGIEDATISRIAADYDVSPASVSRWFNKIFSLIVDMKMQLSQVKDAHGSGPGTSHPKMTGMERTLLNLERELEEKEFTSEEELQAYIEKLNRSPDVLDLPSRKSLSPAEQAQDLLYEAWDEPSPAKRTRLARKALELYPDSADAYNILAETEAKNLTEALNYYKKGMEAGERHLGKAFMEKNKGFFWGIVKTRPFMRAKLGYARTLHEMGRRREAIRQYEELLALNPGDNQGVRYLLVKAYLEMEEYEAADRLLNRTFREEDSAEFNYNRVLLEYGKHGLSPAVKRLFRKAVEQNPHVPDYLTGKKRLPRELPEFVGFGDPREAAAYAGTHLHLWLDRPELLDWVRSQARQPR